MKPNKIIPVDIVNILLKNSCWIVLNQLSWKIKWQNGYFFQCVAAFIFFFIIKSVIIFRWQYFYRKNKKFTLNNVTVISHVNTLHVSSRGSVTSSGSCGFLPQMKPNNKHWTVGYLQRLKKTFGRLMLFFCPAHKCPQKRTPPTSSHSSSTSSSLWLRITSWPWNLKYPTNFFFWRIRGNHMMSSGHIWLKGIWWHSNHSGLISRKQTRK